MKILSIKDGLIPWVTATNLGPNFPPQPSLTNGTGIGQAPTSTTSTTPAPPS